MLSFLGGVLFKQPQPKEAIYICIYVIYIDICNDALDYVGVI